MVNLRELKQLILDKYVVVQKHPEHDLYIYNYSQKTQYERYWTPLTLMCRGLILDGERNVVSRGLNKFFNREELNGDEIPNEPFEVFEKYDGSYINVFRYNGEIIVSSRGSFTSDQAIYTRQLINEKYPCFESHMVNNTSYIFELIADWNRIVVNYGGENKLVLLTAFDTSRKRGTELDFNDVLDWADTLECDVAKRYNFSDYETLKEKIGNNQEGFVVKV